MTAAQEQLDLAVQVERLAGRIYTMLAERFADAPEAQSLFTGLAAEEEQHALRLEMLAATLARRPELSRSLTLDTARIGRALREGEALLTALAPPHPRPPLARARELAARLEEKFAQVHAHQLAAQSEVELREFFALFVAQDREHAALLRRSGH